MSIARITDFGILLYFAHRFPDVAQRGGASVVISHYAER